VLLRVARLLPITWSNMHGEEKGSWTSAIMNRCDTEWMRSENG